MYGLSDDIQELERENARLREKLDEMARVPANLAKENARMREALRQRDQGDVISHHEEHHDEEFGLRAELARLREVLEECRSILTETRNHEGETEDELASLQGRLTVCNEERREQDRELARLREGHNARMKMLHEAEAENARLRESKDKLEVAYIAEKGEAARLRERDEMTQRMWEKTLDENARLREENKQLLLTKAGAFKAQMKYVAQRDTLLAALDIIEKLPATQTGLGLEEAKGYARRARTVISEVEGPEYEDPGPDPQSFDPKWLRGVTGYKVETETLPHISEVEGEK